MNDNLSTLFSLQERLARIPIGDALVSRAGHRIDHVDSNIDGHEPSYAIVAPDNTLLFLSKNDGANSQRETVRFWQGFDWHSAGYLPPTSVDALPNGAESNPLWHTPVRMLTLPGGDWFFKPHPSTGCYREYALLLQTRSMRLFFDHAPLARSVWVLRAGGDLASECQFAINAIYALRQGSITRGYLRLRSIHSLCAAQVTASDAREQGFMALDDLWVSLRCPRPIPARRLLRLRFQRLFSSLESAD